MLISAQDLARRIFEDPSEKAVMDLFQELCAERDRMAWANEGRESATMH
ncbi:hypothetical protein NH44784_007251 [Achromobacter xylosoxidans NH44784-1996]|nr:hypothetical protein NH44784_007251 [Achromobacter xylosoxidans NH44784-1996]